MVPVKTQATKPSKASNGNSRRAARARKMAIASGQQTTVSAAVPINEQSHLMAVVDAERDRAKRDYLHCLVRPDECVARIPDSFAGDTALVSSVSVIKVPCYFTGMGSDAGRFALAVSPTIGSLSSPDNYKVAMVQPTNNGGNYSWPSDLTAPGSFVDQIDGRDIRLDNFYSNLTQPAPGNVSYTLPLAAGGNNDNFPFGVAVAPAAYAGYGLDAKYLNSATTPVVGASTFQLPGGYYNVSMLFDGGVAISAPPVVLGVGGAVVTEFFELPTGNNNSGWIGSVIVPANPAGGLAGFSVAVPGLATGAGAFVQITRSFDDVQGVPQSLGLIQKYRPVACSVLATYTGSTLLDGGNIAGCLVPGGAVDAQFFTPMSTTVQGNLSSWENLGGLKGSMTNPVLKGDYSFYSPSDISDYLMYTPDEAIHHEYPTIVISGQVAPGSSTTPVDGTVFLRVLVYTVYEVSTDSLFLSTRHQKGSQADMDEVLNHLVGVCHSMENPSHTTFGQKILGAFKTAGNWVWKNRKPIISALGTVASLI